LDPIMGCQHDRLANPGEVRAFHWQPCADVADCSEMIPNDSVLGELGVTSSFDSGEVRDTDRGVVFGLTVWLDSYRVVVFTDEDGWVIDGYRAHVPAGCRLGLPGIGAQRYGVVLTQGEFGTHRIGGVLNALDQTESPTPFEVTPTPPGIGPQIWNAMGDERWVWEFYIDRLVSVSSIDGSGYYTIGQWEAEGPILDINFPTGPGDVFYFEVARLVPPNGVQGIIAQSDGLEPPIPYITPQDGSYFGRPAYAHSHIAWLRGTGQTDVNEFATVELWASAYRANPAELQPYKVDDLPGAAMDWLHGGHGYVTMASQRDAPLYSETAVWRLSDNTRFLFPFPGGEPLTRYLGVTPEHAWVLGGGGGNLVPERIVRFTLP
jgi:hypothetical protein